MGLRVPSHDVTFKVPGNHGSWRKDMEWGNRRRVHLLIHGNYSSSKKPLESRPESQQCYQTSQTKASHSLADNGETILNIQNPSSYMAMDFIYCEDSSKNNSTARQSELEEHDKINLKCELLAMGNLFVGLPEEIMMVIFEHLNYTDCMNILCSSKALAKKWDGRSEYNLPLKKKIEIIQEDGEILVFKSGR